MSSEKNQENLKVLMKIFSQGWTMARMTAYNTPLYIIQIQRAFPRLSLTFLTMQKSNLKMRNYSLKGCVPS